MDSQDFITFGLVHLEVRDAERTARFWEVLAGFERRKTDGDSMEVGTADETLLVLHGCAGALYKQGHSGLYHIAIHSPHARDFARLLKRFRDLKYPIAPTDHTLPKAIYLDDPDGINIEFTLEAQSNRLGRLPTFIGVQTQATRPSSSYSSQQHSNREGSPLSLRRRQRIGSSDLLVYIAVLEFILF